MPAGEGAGNHTCTHVMMYSYHRRSKHLMSPNCESIQAEQGTQPAHVLSHSGPAD